MSKFTEQQLRDWKIYEKVRISGRFNMLFPEARVATGLSREDYLFVIKNYIELRDAQPQKKSNDQSGGATTAAS